MRVKKPLISLLAAPLLLGANAASVLAQPQATPAPLERVDPAIREALPFTDEQVGDRVEARLNAEIHIVGAQAIVRDGVVALHGTVRSEEDRMRALGIAREMEGVRRVDDALSVEPTGADDAYTDVERTSLDAAVAAELRGDPVLGSRDIRVTADPRSNTVTLIGVVGSQAERERAQRIASDAFAAGNVRNQLQVRAD